MEDRKKKYPIGSKWRIVGDRMLVIFKHLNTGLPLEMDYPIIGVSDDIMIHCYSIDGICSHGLAEHDIIAPWEEPKPAEPATKYGVGLWNIHDGGEYTHAEVFKVLGEDLIGCLYNKDGTAYAFQWHINGRQGMNRLSARDLTTPYTPPPEPIKFRVWRVWYNDHDNEREQPAEFTYDTLQDGLDGIEIMKKQGIYFGHDFGPNNEGIEITIERKAGE